MEPHEDIYQPPKADVEVPLALHEAPLAGRVVRLGAAIVDSILLMVIVFPVIFALGLMSWERMTSGQQPSLVQNLASFGISMTVFLLLNGYTLARSGQTLGKKLLGVQIVGLDGKILSLGRLMALRVVPLWLVAMVPVVGSFFSLIDALFIFRGDRRCVHDLIAGTRVIVAR